MKILYAIQGTGNGHISRAMEIVPLLKERADVDVLVSASQWDLPLPFPVDYRMKGFGFVFGKKGGVDILNTYLEMDSLQLMREIRNLPVDKYDLVISDFEPVSTWACKLKKKVCIGLSNQAATLHPLAPKPETIDPFGKLILERYAPCTQQYGFHFKAFDDKVYTPIIRKEVRHAAISDHGHITVYLPSFDDELILNKLRHYTNTRFEIFSKQRKSMYRERNFSVFPLNNSSFIRSMASSSGVISNAGFGAVSEALFLNKKCLVIPMKTQFEQQCNAAVLESMGVTVIKNLKKKNYETISGWLSEGKPIPVNYPDQTAALLDMIIERHGGQLLNEQGTDSDMRFLRKLLAPRHAAAAF
ncbi:glycosyltransferase family protein [soil metagenome]